jgi:polyisoprenoid-binding protein YceI
MTLAAMALAATAYSAEALAADKYALDHAHTTVGFSVKHMVITSVKGTFGEFDGTIEFDEEDLTKTSASGAIQVASIDTNNEKRDAHLTSGDFFDAEKHPEILFASKKVESRKDGHVMIGDMTIRGVTKEIEIPFELVGKITDPMGNVRIGLRATAEINRQDFGVSWSKTLDGGGLVVGDRVKIELDIEAIKAAEE